MNLRYNYHSFFLLSCILLCCILFNHIHHSCTLLSCIFPLASIYLASFSLASYSVFHPSVLNPSLFVLLLASFSLAFFSLAFRLLLSHSSTHLLARGLKRSYGCMWCRSSQPLHCTGNWNLYTGFCITIPTLFQSVRISFGGQSNLKPS
jgi:hypothetical protein